MHRLRDILLIGFVGVLAGAVLVYAVGPLVAVAGVGAGSAGVLGYVARAIA